MGKFHTNTLMTSKKNTNTQKLFVFALLAIAALVSVFTLRLQGQSATSYSDLEVTLAGPPVIIRGEPVNYTYTIRNNGFQDDYAVQLSDTLQGNFVFQSAEGATCYYNPVSKSVVCYSFFLGVNQTQEITLTFIVPKKDNCTEVSVNHTGEVRGKSYDNTPANNKAPTVVSRLLCAPEETATLQDNGDTLIVETKLNSGIALYFDVQNSNGTVYTGAWWMPGPRMVVEDLNEIFSPYIESGEYTVQLQVCPRQIQYTDRMRKTECNPPMRIAYTQKSSGGTVKTSNNKTDLSVRVEAPQAITRGEPADHYFVIANNSSTDEPAVTFTDPLLGSLTLVSSEGATCTQTNRTITCNPFALRSGETKTLKLVLLVAPKANCTEASVGHTANVRGTVEDADMGNNDAPSVNSRVLCQRPVSSVSSSSAPASSRVSSAAAVISSTPSSRSSSSRSSVATFPDLTVRVDAPAQIVRGVAARIPVTVTNIGTGTEPAARLYYQLVGNSNFLGAEGATCTVEGALISCNPFEVTTSKPVVVTFVLTVPEKAGCTDASANHTAAVEGSRTDTNGSNNMSGLMRSAIICLNKPAAQSSSSSQPNMNVGVSSVGDFSSSSLRSFPSSISRMSSSTSSAVSISSRSNLVTSSSSSRTVSSALPGSSAGVLNSSSSSSSSVLIDIFRLPNEASSDPTCRSHSFKEDAAVCINRVIQNHTASRPLMIILEDNKEYKMRSQTIVMFNEKNVYMYGNNVTLKMEEPVGARQIDQYFMVNILGSSRILIYGITFDGGNLAGQRGIGVCPLPNFPIDSIRVSNTKAKNIADSYFIAGNSHNEYLATSTKFTNIPALNAARNLPKEDRYCTGELNNILFSENTVEVGTPDSETGVGFYIAPLSARFATGSIATADNWITKADIAASKTKGVRVEKNTFIAKSDNVNSFIKVQQMRDLTISKNTFTATGFPKALSIGAAINISANTQKVNVNQNIITLDGGQKDKARAVVVESGFRNHIWYGVGSNGLATPALDVLIQNNTFKKSRARIMNCCKYDNPTTAALCTNVSVQQAVAAKENVRFGSNTTDLGIPSVGLTSVIDAGKTNAKYCRPASDKWVITE